MKIHIIRAITAVICLAVQMGAHPVPVSDLPDYMRIDLKRLEETWNVLDQCAERIWPGWDSYRDVPFRFSYPNGISMLVGHPDPTDGFELVEGFEVQGKAVHIDRSNEIPLKLTPPLSGGGGIITFGKTKPVPIVDLRISESRKKPDDKAEIEQDAKKVMPEEYRVSGEKQILINIHELFHCFQRTVYRYRFGNFQCNPDANYAVYSEVEGRALEQAFLASDDARALRYLKDFAAARKLKRRDLLEMERNQESEDGLMEGTAVYSEAMALNLIKKGYKPFVTREDDPYFLGFQYVDDLLDEKLESLKESSRMPLDARGKCYPYGCFQALLLSRLFPGWQADFFQEKKLLDQAISENLKLSPEEEIRIVEEFPARYPMDEIKTCCTESIEKRDAALALFEARRGRVYVVDFKPTREFVIPEWRGEAYVVGLMELAPEGLERVQIRDVLLEAETTPIMKDQLYYIKWVDTETPADRKGYTLEFDRKEGDGIFYDAVFRTKGFTLRAPRIRIKDRKSRVKVTILEKIKT